MMGAKAALVLLVLASGCGKAPSPQAPRTYLDVIALRPSDLGDGGQVVEFLGEDAVVKVAPDSHCPGRMNVSVQAVRLADGSCARSMKRVTRELTDLYGEPQPSDAGLIPTFKGTDVASVVVTWAVEQGIVQAACMGVTEKPKRKSMRMRLSVTRKWQLTPSLPKGNWQRKYLGRGSEGIHGCAE